MSGTHFGGIEDWSAEAALTEGVLTRRLAAFVVDGLLVAVLMGTLFVVLLMLGLLTLGLGLPLLGLIPVVPVLYNWLSLLTGSSATPGQAVFGLCVRRDADLGSPTALQALVWTIGFVVTISLGMVWFAVALVTTRHRTLHDLVAGLVVVRGRAVNRTLTGTAPAWKTGSALKTGPAWKTGRGGRAFE